MRRVFVVYIAVTGKADIVTVRVIAFIGFIAWWVTLFTQIFLKLKGQNTRDHASLSLLAGIFSGLSGICIAGFFENNFRDGEVQTAILTTMGLALVLIRQNRQSQPQ